MTSEFIRKAVMKFLPAQSFYIWCKCRLQAILSIQRCFNLTGYKEVIVNEFTAHIACRNADSNLIHICIDFLYLLSWLGYQATHDLKP